MFLSNENYFSSEAEQIFFGSSSYKNFSECSGMAMAKLRKEYDQEQTKSMKVGSFVDSHFEGSMQEFRIKNKDIFLKNGIKLAKDYRHAEYIIERIEKDKKMMQFLAGEKQKIMTGDISGVKFKIKMDSYFPEKAIVDLKVMKDLNFFWKNKVRLNFIEYWRYDIQGAIYQEIVRQETGKQLPFYIVVATKEKEPNLAIIQISQEKLDSALEEVKNNVLGFREIKEGRAEVSYCNKCDYCKSIKESEIFSYDDLDDFITRGTLIEDNS